MASRNDPWNEARDVALRFCIVELKQTFLETAAILNKQFGKSYTRSAIGGRAWRLRLCSPNAAAPRVGVPQVRTEARARASEARRKPIHQRVLPMPQFNRDGLTGLRCAEVEPLHLTLLEVIDREGCKWPFGHGPFTFCGHAPLAGRPYCLDHEWLSVGSGTAAEKAAHRTAGLA